jgi:hypothetical protein
MELQAIGSQKGRKNTFFAQALGINERAALTRRMEPSA